jgi:uncharacterized protein YdeI (YjbR/CyaY-like superfamily)
MSAPPPDQPLRFEDPSAWRDWLKANHATHHEAWLVILKVKSPRPGIYLVEAVEEALCFGWIDSLMHSTGEGYYYLRFSPRQPGSVWAASNLQRVERLIAEGRMTEAGMAQVRQAQESGEWQAALRREDVTSLPDDLRTALESSPQAQANFESYPASYKKQLLYWIDSARSASVW